MTWCIFGCGGGGRNIATEFWERADTGRVCRLDFAEPESEGLWEIKAIDRDTRITNIAQKVLHIEDLDGLARNPEELICAKERNEIGRKVYEEILLDEYISPESTKRCRNILFTVGLGGGTGTGIINPITHALRRSSGGEREKGSIEAFVGVLGVLTEKTKDKKNVELNQRCFGAILALYDLLARKGGVDAVFLVDNEQLIREGEGQTVKYRNDKIFEYFFPMVNSRRVDSYFTGRDLRNIVRDGKLKTAPPIIVPCYYGTDKKVTDKKEDAKAFLTEAFGDDGEEGNIEKLMKCNHKKADKVIVYTSLLSPAMLEGAPHHFEVTVEEKIKSWIGDNNKVIQVCRVLDVKQKILVLLRNPYGNGEDEFFNRIADMVKKAGDFAEKKEKAVFESIEKYSAFKDINDRDEKLKSFTNKLLNEFDNMCDKLKSDTDNRPLLEGNKTVEELINEVIKEGK